MKKENRFLTIFSISILLIILTGYLLYTSGILSHSDWISILYGLILTSFNFILGITSLIIALKSNEKRFLIMLFGGMLVRLLLMVSGVYLVLRFLQIRLDIFIFVIFVFYSFYLIAEIIFFYLSKERKI